MNVEDILIRTIGAMAFGLSIAGFCVISERGTKLLFALSSLAWGAQYYLLGVHTGFLIMLLTSVRQAVTIYSNVMGYRLRIALVLGFGGVAVAIAAFTWQGWLASSLPLAATLLGTWALFMMGNVGMRKATLATNALWAVHGYLFNSWELCLTMIVITVANVYGLYRLRGVAVVP
ncbi:MAG: YgjV family protein [Gammaproteobacteria bacterium]|uniref:YgjV family protein n=1 Tax=Limnobacter sp. TaxID=2003368 RepID=UPI001D49A7C2|nr:YgjV family protein [Limnobacter sp.]MBU0785081.1 YgjV family protein [Gammaproteobacteria bacterium]MBU0849119.1 YgjV family protein [Gammaproteobacteria bacterium]MBU1267870.1 YgjV family protein [Gammaproteobacteria bacterium]MBU1528375.1 YgjV family protein [Gammaproteobacteria bacterium]MBU1781456.1 YgjV family protein [Gammaproteobacteria bacterium]